MARRARSRQPGQVVTRKERLSHDQHYYYEATAPEVAAVRNGRREADILSQPPRITYDDSGLAWLQLADANGDPGPEAARELISRVASTEHGVVMVATTEAVYLRSDAEYQEQRAKRPVEQVDLEDVTDRATDIVEALINLTDKEDLPPPARVFFEAGQQLWQRTWHTTKRYTSERRFAYMLVLDALLSTPKALDLAICRLRNELREADPALALVGDHALEVTFEDDASPRRAA